MPRITKIYTRTGDDGTTSLGTGQRIDKAAPRIEAYGTVDELNALLGTVLASEPAAELIGPLQRIQNALFHLGADLCVPEVDKARRPGPRIKAEHVADLESLIDTLNKQLEPLANFALPGGTVAAAQLHLARTVCRRAERRALVLAKSEPLGRHVVPYLNRLSDALFVMARFENKARGVAEPLWDSHA